MSYSLAKLAKRIFKKLKKNTKDLVRDLALKLD
jgi:hypothetical protein